MILENAIKCLKEQYPDRVITGYLQRGDSFVFNTKLPKQFRDLITPAQFVVTNEGEVYGTNPFRENLDMDDMKKIHV